MRVLAGFVLVLLLATGPGGPGATAPEEPAPAAEERLEEFEPTEAISSDTAVSFPVDI